MSLEHLCRKNNIPTRTDQHQKIALDCFFEPQRLPRNPAHLDKYTGLQHLKLHINVIMARLGSFQITCLFCEKHVVQHSCQGPTAAWHPHTEHLGAVQAQCSCHLTAHHRTNSHHHHPPNQWGSQDQSREHTCQCHQWSPAPTLWCHCLIL